MKSDVRLACPLSLLPSMNRTLVTPDPDGRVDFPADSDALFGASAYFERKIDQSIIRWLPDIWADRERGMRVALESAEASAELARRILVEMDGEAEDARIPLVLDVAINFVELVLERMLRLATAGWSPAAARVLPSSSIYRLRRIRLGHEYHTAYSKQPLQWLMLRLLAQSDDRVEWVEDSWQMRVRDGFSREQSWWRLRRRGSTSPALYGGQLAAFGPFIKESGFRVQRVPDLLQAYCWRRNKRLRARLADMIGEVLSPLFKSHGVGAAGLPRLADLLSEMLPVTRIEARDRNIARYRHWFDRHAVAGFITATGMAFHDQNVFFMAECRRRAIPTVVIQHGGQYGYDARIPTYFSRDMCTPSHFVSWGWREFPGGYRSTLPTAKIVPLPNPVLSELRVRGATARRPENPRTLLVPLSKLRTLDPRIGGNATDGYLPAMRRFVIDAITSLAADFPRIVITYRSRNFTETDPVAAWAERAGIRGLVIRPAQQAPVRAWLDKVHAVLWDTAATGFLETLAFGLPTVALLPRDRWATEARWAEDLLAQCGVAVYDSPTAVESVRRFVGNEASWAEARMAVRPVLDAYGLATDDYRDQWRRFLNQLGT